MRVSGCAPSGQRSRQLCAGGSSSNHAHTRRLQLEERLKALIIVPDAAAAAVALPARQADCLLLVPAAYVELPLCGSELTGSSMTLLQLAPLVKAQVRSWSRRRLTETFQASAPAGPYAGVRPASRSGGSFGHLHLFVHPAFVCLQPRAFHFVPPRFGYPITAIYALNALLEPSAAAAAHDGIIFLLTYAVLTGC
jgi:hypothetical protein